MIKFDTPKLKKRISMGLAAKDSVTGIAPARTLKSLFGHGRLTNQIGISKLAVPAGDALAFALAALGGTLIKWWYNAGEGDIFGLWFAQWGPLTLFIYSALAFLALGRFWLFGHYTRRRPFADEVREMLSFLLLLAVADAALMYLAKLAFSRFWFLSTWIMAFALVPSARILSKSILIRLGKWQIPTLIIGTGPNAKEAAEALHSERIMGLQVVAFATLRRDQVPAYNEIRLRYATIPVAYLTDPAEEIAAVGQPNIVVALGPGELATSQRLTEQLHRRFSELSIVPALKGLPLYGMEINHFFRHEALFLRLQNNLGRRGPQILKRAFDIAVSSLLLTLLAPLFAYIAVQIKRSSKGTAFFSHQRIGCRGRIFNCYKFRSMVPNAQEILNELLQKDAEAREEWYRDFKLKDDPRITPIGAFLRRTSLDELPQLWNVLRGDMSLVGPRPVTEVELGRYGDCVEYYLETRPGVTGLWQISGRNDTDYANRVYLDTWYVKNWSLWQDIVILIKTVNVVFGKDGAY